jgi:hypothetical protein
VASSASQASGVLLSGDAAHIWSAAKSGPRSNPDVSAQDIAAEENGIWLCVKHARIVDADESRYTESILRQWKSRAIELARLEVDHGRRESPSDLVQHQAEFSFQRGDDALRQWVSNFLEDIATKMAWGSEEGDLVQIVLYELLRNARDHGSSDQASLSSAPDSIELSYPSSVAFGLADLIQGEGRGGKDSVLTLRSRYAHVLNLNYSAEVGKCTWTLSYQARGAPKGDRCSAQVNRSDLRDPKQLLLKVADCATVHLHGHVYGSMSDNYDIIDIARDIVEAGSSVVIHVSSGELEAHLRNVLSRKGVKAGMVDIVTRAN